MLSSLRTTRGRVGVALVSNLAIAALWMSFEASIGILPVLLIPSWIAVFARQQEPVSPGKQRFTVVALGVGLLLFLGVATIDFTQT